MYCALCQHKRAVFSPTDRGLVSKLKRDLLAFVRDPKCPYEEMKGLKDSIINIAFCEYKSYAWHGKGPAEFDKLMTDFDSFIAKKAAV